jgi:hypothetical protein
MIATIHKLFIAGLYLAVIAGAIAWAYSGGPSDAEMFQRAAEPFNL